MKVVARACGDEVLVLEPIVHGDARGCFFEAFRADQLAALGLHGPWVQDNHSVSQAGVLRGIHFQWDEPQGKLVRVGRGRALDVVVDLRHQSPTFGTWKAFEIDAVKHHHMKETLKTTTDFVALGPTKSYREDYDHWIRLF